ncbi:MAG: cohesin domain-containing protein [bacterium]
MKNQTPLAVIFLVFFGSSVFCQTASLPTVTANPGENVTLPITVTNFINIGAITLYIQFDPAVLTFITLTGQPSGTLAGIIGGNILSIAWSDLTPLTISSGTLMNLVFTYNGPGTSPLTFLPGCEVAQMVGIIPIPIVVAYTNGLVSPNLSNPTKATLLAPCAITGTAVSVPIKYEGFGSNVGSITQKIQYDPAKLTYTSVTMTGNLAGGSANASGGIITIAWSNPSGASINYPGNQFILNFIYTGTTATNLIFYPGCLITTNATVNIPVSYFDGTITPSLVPSPPVVTVVDGCGSSVLTASGVPGASFAWSTGATTASITVYTPGAYTVTQSLGGCTSPSGTGTAAPIIVPAPTVSVANNFGYSILTAGGYTGSLLWSTGASTASITVTTAGTYTVTQTVSGCTSPPGSGTAAPITGYNVSGQVKYDNTPGTPLNGVNVELKNPATGATIATATTAPGGSGQQGFYSFDNLAPGSYRLAANYNGTWGGNNATDALDVQLNLVGMWPLYFLKAIVADVSASGTITSLDALLIKQRVVAIITSYPAGDWKFTDTTFTVSTNASILLKALCTGDVNGSHIP